MKLSLVSLVSLALATLTVLPASAQETQAHVDAPLVVLGPTARFQKLGDINGDGSIDAFGAWWTNDLYQKLNVTAYINNGEGAFTTSWSMANGMNVLPVHTDFWAFAAGDQNADGLCDLV